MAIGNVNTDNMKKIVDLLYPVGSVYTNTKTETLPAALAAVGTWKRINGGTFLLAATTNDTYGLGRTGGEETHQLTISEMPKHHHGITRWAIYDNNVINSNKIAGTGANASGGSNYLSTNTWNEGEDGYHNNMPPYQCVAMWERTA